MNHKLHPPKKHAQFPSLSSFSLSPPHTHIPFENYITSCLCFLSVERGSLLLKKSIHCFFLVAQSLLVKEVVLFILDLRENEKRIIVKYDPYPLIDISLCLILDLIFYHF